MNKTVAEVVAEGKHVEAKIGLDVLVDKETGNLLYPCQVCGKVFDKFIYVSDPSVDPSKPVNQVCAGCKRKWQRKALAAKFLAFVQAAATGLAVKAEGKFVNFEGLAVEAVEAFLRDKLGFKF